MDSTTPELCDFRQISDAAGFHKVIFIHFREYKLCISFWKLYFQTGNHYSDSLNIASKSSLQLLTGYKRSQCAWDQEGSQDMRFSVLKQGKLWANWDELVTLTSGIRPDLTSHWRKELGKSLEITVQETRAGSLSTKQTGSTDRSQRFTC